MPETTIRFDRLLTLAEHLEKPQEEMGHTFFSMRWWYLDNRNGRYDPCEGYRGLPRGTFGDAFGEIRHAFPVEFKSFEDACKVERGSRCPWTTMPLFFGIPLDATVHLFSPTAYDSPQFQDPKRFGGQTITESSSKEEIAANIRAFVAKMQADAAENQETDR